MANFAGAAPSLYATWRRLRRGIPGFIKGFLRRQSEILLPDREARKYRLWIAERVRNRQSIYTEALQPGLLSVLTPVWNQSPIKYLESSPKSVIATNSD